MSINGYREAIKKETRESWLRVVDDAYRKFGVRVIGATTTHVGASKFTVGEMYVEVLYTFFTEIKPPLKNEVSAFLDSHLPDGTSWALTFPYSWVEERTFHTMNEEEWRGRMYDTWSDEFVDEYNPLVFITTEGSDETPLSSLLLCINNEKNYPYPVDVSDNLDSWCNRLAIEVTRDIEHEMSHNLQMRLIHDFFVNNKYVNPSFWQVYKFENGEFLPLPLDSDLPSYVFSLRDFSEEMVVEESSSVFRLVHAYSLDEYIWVSKQFYQKDDE